MSKIKSIGLIVAVAVIVFVSVKLGMTERELKAEKAMDLRWQEIAVNLRLDAAAHMAKDSASMDALRARLNATNSVVVK